MGRPKHSGLVGVIRAALMTEHDRHVRCTSRFEAGSDETSGVHREIRLDRYEDFVEPGSRAGFERAVELAGNLGDVSAEVPLERNARFRTAHRRGVEQRVVGRVRANHHARDTGWPLRGRFGIDANRQGNRHSRVGDCVRKGL